VLVVLALGQFEAIFLAQAEAAQAGQVGQGLVEGSIMPGFVAAVEGVLLGFGAAAGLAKNCICGARIGDSVCGWRVEGVCFVDIENWTLFSRGVTGGARPWFANCGGSLGG
jgi:hypothetical protein